MAGNALRGSVVCLGNEEPLLSGMQGVEMPLPHTPFPASAGTGRDIHHCKHTPVCCNFLSVSAAAGNFHTPQLWPPHPSSA